MTGTEIAPGESGELVVRFESDSAMVAAIKQLSDRRLAILAAHPPCVQHPYITVSRVALCEFPQRSKHHGNV